MPSGARNATSLGDGQRKLPWTASAATAAFMATFVFVKVPTPFGPLETRSLLLDTLLLGVLALPLVLTDRTGRSAARVAITASVVGLLTVITTLTTWTNLPVASQLSFVGNAGKYVAYFAVIAAFATRCYEQRRFMETFWFFGRAAIWVALGGYVLSLFGLSAFVNDTYSSTRLQGTLSEPSAWAPLASAMLLISLQRRAYQYSFLVALVSVLTRSPTVIIVLAIGVPMFYIVRQRRGIWTIVALACLAALAPWALDQLASIDVGGVTAEQGAIEELVTRLADGVRYIQTGGELGDNVRAASASILLRELSDNGWLWLGYGIGSSDIFFTAKYGPDIRANSLLLDVLFNFGIVGVVVVAVVLLVAVRRIRHSTELHLFLPFMVASLVNSAEGWASYKFVLLAAFLFAFGWRRDYVVSSDGASPANVSFDLESGHAVS